MLLLRIVSLKFKSLSFLSASTPNIKSKINLEHRCGSRCDDLDGWSDLTTQEIL